MTAALIDQCRPNEDADPGVFEGRDMLCFSHDFTGDPLSKTHLMRLLARRNRILWVNSIGYRAPTVSRRDIRRAFSKLTAAMAPITERESNIFVMNPLAIPAYGSPMIRKLNQRILRMQVRRAMHKLRFRRPINWVFNPAAAVIAGALGEDRLIYYCVDEYTAFSGVSGDHLAQLEEQLLRRADLVIVSAQPLLDSKKHFNPRTILIRHGVDHAHFCKALADSTTVPAEIASLPRPVVGFFGLIADWVDVDLMAEVAKHFSTGSLVVLGRATTDISVLQSIPNVHILGRKPYESLPAYCKGFDVAINPFRINRLTINANPLKVREYLAAGLPVVSTSIPEVEALRQCRIGHGTDGFIREIEAALKDPGPSVARSDAIGHESWEARLNSIARQFTDLCGDKEASFA
jgi:glycosyltransferase involved in cell wall biosynthesis